MKYRKILAMALSCVMAFSMTACGGTELMIKEIVGC